MRSPLKLRSGGSDREKRRRCFPRNESSNRLRINSAQPLQILLRHRLWRGSAAEQSNEEGMADHRPNEHSHRHFHISVFQLHQPRFLALLQQVRQYSGAFRKGIKEQLPSSGSGPIPRKQCEESIDTAGRSALWR